MIDLESCLSERATAFRRGIEEGMMMNYIKLVKIQVEKRKRKRKKKRDNALRIQNESRVQNMFEKKKKKKKKEKSKLSKFCDFIVDSPLLSYSSMVKNNNKENIEH